MNGELMLMNSRQVQRGQSRDFLRQEIAFFEGRLIEMGEAGDCAYERALSKVYQALLAERKHQLAESYMC